MEVILLERVEKLGQMGEVVNVKPGFARNYLLPQKKALRATKSNIAEFEGQRAQFETQNLEKRDEAQGIGTKLDGLTVIVVRQASDSDQLYGSVTTRDIAKQVTAAGFTVNKNQIQLERPIKSVGLHPVRVRLHPEVVVTVTANVARTEDEAEMQARGERPGAMDDEDMGNAEDQSEAIELSEEASELLEDSARPDADRPGGDSAPADAADGEEQPDG